MPTLKSSPEEGTLEKKPSNCWESNPQPLTPQTSALTTRPPVPFHSSIECSQVTCLQVPVIHNSVKALHHTLGSSLS